MPGFAGRTPRSPVLTDRHLADRWPYGFWPVSLDVKEIVRGLRAPVASAAGAFFLVRRLDRAKGKREFAGGFWVVASGPLPNWEDDAEVTGNSQLGRSGMPESCANLKLTLSSLLQRAFPIRWPPGPFQGLLSGVWFIQQ